MHFESPYAFLLLVLLPALVLLRRRGRRTSLRFSTTRNAARAGRSLRQNLSWLPAALRALAMILLVIALARPQRGLERIRDVNKGIAIEMVVDRSGSMGAEMEYRGERLNRLDVVKRVFEEFVIGNKHDLKGRPSDMVGMIAFARYPDTIAPLTLAHGALPAFLKSVKLVQRRAEDGTAIGDALALAAARLKTAEDTLARQLQGKQREYDIKSKVIILLTDGENNAGKRHPVQAAKLAAEWGIKVYTIGVGGGEAVQTMQTPMGAFKIPVGRGVDDRTLKAIAAETGGRYRRADSARALESIYKEIDKLERTEIETVRYVDYRELFMPFALAALALLALETALRTTLFRRIP